MNEIKSEYNLLLGNAKLIFKSNEKIKKEKLNYIKKNTQYKKIWNLINSDNEIFLEKYSNNLINNIPIINEDYFDIFFDISNLYSYEFIEYIYKRVLKIDSSKNENFPILIIGEFHKLQEFLKTKIGNIINKFESFLRSILINIMCNNNLNFKNLGYTPKILQKPNSEFKKSIETFTTIKELINSNERLWVVFEEMNFEDYRGIIKKFNNKIFLKLLDLLLSNPKNLTKWDLKGLSIFITKSKNFSKLDNESINIIKVDFLKKIENIQNLRNKIFHNKTIIFKNWLNQENNLFIKDSMEDIEHLYNLFYSKEKENIEKLKKEINEFVEKFREKLIYKYKLFFKEKEITDFTKTLI